MFKQMELVTSYFGYWPEFADGKVVRITYDATGVIELVIFYIDAENQKAAHVGLRFVSVTDVVITELRSENVIDSLSLSEDAPHRVSVEACYGLSGTFMCKNVEVLYVYAYE